MSTQAPPLPPTAKPCVIAERMDPLFRVWQAGDLLVDVYTMPIGSREERAEVRRLISQAQRIPTEAKALLA